MKVQMPIIVVVLGCMCLGGGFLAGVHWKRMEMSLAGGTLQGFCRALDAYKSEKGEYPEKLALVDGSSFVTGDYSSEIAARIVYFRTEKGFFMMVGLPAQAFTDETGHIHFAVP